MLTSPESIRGLSCPELTDSVEPVEMGGEVYVRGAALRSREREDGKEGIRATSFIVAGLVTNSPNDSQQVLLVHGSSHEGRLRVD